MHLSLVRGLLTVGLVAGLAGAATGLNAGPSATAALPAVSVAERAPSADCVRAFSKDYCDGFMHAGTAEEFECLTGTQPCKTVRVKGATLFLPLQSNTQLCSSNGRCDEAQHLDEMKVAVDYIVRLHDPCPFRGCIEGKGEVRTSSGGNVYQGTLMGTIGVGTHRPFACPEYRTCLCERCLDVEFIAAAGVWRIGFEASFHGTRVDVATGEEVCISMSGDWYLKGNADGPFDWSGNFKVKGTADGIWLSPCF